MKEPLTKRIADSLSITKGSLKQLFIHLPLYLRDKDEYRQYIKRSQWVLMFNKRLTITIVEGVMPYLSARVCDGMGEHYGYPRHHCYIIIYWNRKGYAFGVASK